MDADRLDRLTDQQRICLRFVYAHMTSKQIAPRLGIEPGSVDQHIKAAMRVLGVGDRRTAAIMLAEHEQLPPQPLAYQPLDIASAPRSATFGPSTENGRQLGEATAGALREDQAAYDAAPPLRSARLQLPLPVRGRRPGDLGTLLRLGWIFAIMVAIALSFGVFMAGVEALSRLGRTLG